MNINETVEVNSEVYTIVQICTESGTDEGISLYVGKDFDGGLELIARDNGSFWLVGNPDDMEDNVAMFKTIERAGAAWAIDEIKDDTLRSAIKTLQGEANANDFDDRR